MRNKTGFNILLGTAILFILVSCTNGNKVLSKETSEALKNGGIIYLTSNRRLMLDTLSGEKIEISEYFTSRVSYSRNSATLLVNSLEVVKKILIFNPSGREFLGYNFDSCDMAAFSEKGESIVFVTYESFIYDQQTLEGPLALAIYNSEKGLELITILNLEYSSSPVIDRCILGSNAEHNNSLYYKDISEGANVIYQLNLATSEAKIVLSVDSEIIAPTISPNGKFLAFTSLDGIYLYDISLEEPTRIYPSTWYKDTIQAGYDFDSYYHPSKFIPVVSWSPDSTRVVFSEFVFLDGDEASQVKIIDVNSMVQNPEHAVQQFRNMSATNSGGCRPLIPEHVGHFFMTSGI
jgi:Tol biopolymer transport system component